MSSISFDELTNGQIGEIELAIGRPMSDLFINDEPSWLLLTAMTWLALRKDNPAITYAEVRDGKYEVVSDFLGGMVDPKGNKLGE